MGSTKPLFFDRRLQSTIYDMHNFLLYRTTKRTIPLESKAKKCLHGARRRREAPVFPYAHHTQRLARATCETPQKPRANIERGGKTDDVKPACAMKFGPCF